MKKAAAPAVIYPSWQAPDSVVALSTTRMGGISRPPFDTFNLALHVEDVPADVQVNRGILQNLLGDAVQLQWLRQVHGTDVVLASRVGGEKVGDAVFIDRPGLAGVVMTADCLPVFLAARNGQSVAVAHAGWRGLVNGVIERTLDSFRVPPADVLCWLGPAIGPCHFEVGMDVRQAFLDACSDDDLRSEMATSGFHAAKMPGKFFANLYALARLRLQRYGVVDIQGGDFCTHCDRQRFYSYRRDSDTGRMASVIGLRALS